MPFIPDVIPDDVPEELRSTYFTSASYQLKLLQWERRKERLDRTAPKREAKKQETALRNAQARAKEVARIEAKREARKLELFVEKFNKKLARAYKKANSVKRPNKPSKTGLSPAEAARFNGYRRQVMKASREYLDLATPNEQKKIDVRKRAEEAAQKRAVVAAAKAASKAKYEADLVYFRENREAIKEAARQRRNLARPLQVAKAAGFDTVEAYKEYISKKPHPMKKPPEVTAEARRIRDQWRNYRRQVKNGMSANGGRIPRGFLEAQWNAQAGNCAICGGGLDTNFEIDHIIPVAKGGSNIATNLQLTHALCNIKKSDSLPQWMTECS